MNRSFHFAPGWFFNLPSKALQAAPTGGCRADNSGHVDHRRSANFVHARKTIASLLRSCLSLILFSATGAAFSQQPPLIPVTMPDIYTYKEVTGYIDTTGALVIEPRFESASRFSEGLASIKQEGKYGFIDSTGNIVIKPIYDKAWSFSEGLCTVVVKGKIGFIDKTGKMVIEPSFVEAGSFSEGLAAVKIKDKYGFIDSAGRIAIPPSFSLVRGFSEGLAAVKIPGGGADGLWGYIDKSGSMAIKPQFQGWTIKDITNFKDGLAIVQKGVLTRTFWYVIDKKGAVVLDTKIDFLQNNPVNNFSEGVAVFASAKGYEDRLPPGFIDKRGKITRPMLKVKDTLTGAETSIPSVIGDFHEGKAYVKVNEKWGFIYQNGNFAYQPMFEDVEACGHYAPGIVTFKLDGKWCHRTATKLIFDGRKAKWDSKEHKIIW